MEKDNSIDHAVAHVKSRIERGELVLPKYPILKVWELPGTPQERDAQLRIHLPDDKRQYLPSHHLVVEIEEKRFDIPQDPIDPFYVCMLATNAASPDEIGKFGPAAASVNPMAESNEPPRFHRPHGRDGLRVAKDLVDEFPQLADVTIQNLLETQGVENEANLEGEPFRQEQIGSTILLDMPPDDPIGQKFTMVGGWGFPRYASADATGSLVSFMADRWRKDPSYLIKHNYDARDGQTYTYTKGFERGRQWLIDRTDESPDGLVEYRLHKYGGMRNQGWRDAANSILHSDGSWANSKNGVAAIDVLAISFDGLVDAAEISLKAYDDKKMHDMLIAKAMSIRDYVLEHGIYQGHLVSGFDRDGAGSIRQIRPMTSAAGRALGSKMFFSDDPLIQEVVRQNIKALLEPGMFTRWGIRTMSADEIGYSPVGYHNGEIWRHDTDEIAENISHHGFHGLDRVIGATTTHQWMHTKRLCEKVPGYDNDEIEIPMRNTYVYEPIEDELYLFEQVPADTTWSASSQWKKQRRYQLIPHHAIDPKKLAFEKERWRVLPDHVQQIARKYEPKTAAALSQ